jgi:hypothetical protein
MVVSAVLAGAAARAAQQPAVEQLAAEKTAAEKTAAQMLPASTLFYAEVHRPQDVIRLVLDHPLRKRLEQSEDYRKAFDTPQFKEFMTVVEAVEKRSKVEWRKALEVSTGGGVVVAFDPETQGVVLLARSTDPATTTAIRDALLDLAKEDAAAKGKPSPIETVQYRGITAYKAGDSTVGNVGPWLVVSNKTPLAKAVADTFLDGGKTLADDAQYKTARGADAAASGRTAWAFVRLDPLRRFAPNHPVFDKSARSDNPAAELLLGGLAAAARNAPYVTASLTLKQEGLKLAVVAPHDAKWVPEGREFFFATGGKDGGADAPLKPKGTLLSVTTYRDLAAWWQAAPDVYTEGVAAQMAQADSGLSTFLGGKSFGTDILGAVAPQMQFVVAAQDYKAADVPEPTIKLPAFAGIFRLREKEAAKANLGKHFRVAFQSIVALGNLDGASKGRPLLEMRTERRGGAEILYAVYEPPAAADAAAEPEAKAQDGKTPAPDAAKDAAAKDPAEKGVHYNFSPALVVSKTHLMFCSTKEIALELADLAAKQGGGESSRIPQNTLLDVSAKPIADLLRDNREQLVAQNMLEKGHDRAAAEKEIDVFIALVNAVRDAKISLTPTDKSITLEIDVRTDTSK